MSESNSDLRSLVDDLVQTCKDGQEGFKQAAENIDDADIKSLFLKNSMERSKFAGELQAASHSLGESDPANSGSLSGAAHRGWINLKAALLGNDRHAVLAECERGEDVAVGQYRDALKKALPGDLKETVQRQYESVLASHDMVKALRDSAKV